MIDAFSFWLILIFCIVGTYILTPVLKRFEAYWKGYNKGYKDGMSHGIWVGGEQMRKTQHFDMRG